MSLTIGIPNYNYGQYIARAIESALKYADQVIVVDNASTDDSLEVIQRYPEVHAVLHKMDRGICASMNEIIRLAKGDRLMLLDSDDYLIGDPRLLDGAEWCYSDLYINDDGVISIRDYTWMPDNYHDAVNWVYRNRSLPLSMKGTFSMNWIRTHKLHFVDWPNVTYAEDTLTCLEWLKTNPTVKYCPTPCYVYRNHEIDDGPRRRQFELDLDAYLRGHYANLVL